MSEISLIIPCFNEEEVVLKSHERIEAAIKEVHKKFEIKSEIIYVDDGSTDKTLALLKGIIGDRKFYSLKIISFSRNFGHQLAISAGIDICKGDAAIIIDADLQDPPELIVDMIEKWLKGYDVVYGLRTKRKGESRFKLSSAKLFYRLLDYLSDIHIPQGTGDFRLIDKKVISVIKDMPESSRFLRGMISWVGFKQAPVEYVREKRYAGKTKYPFAKMISLAITGLTSFSVRPLRIATMAGFFFGILATILLVYVLWSKIYGNPVEGWTAIMASIFLLGGVQLFCLGIIGEYLGFVFLQQKNRPKYVISEVINSEKE